MTAYSHPTIEQKEEFVQTAFDMVAENYDRMNRVMTMGRFNDLHRAFAPTMGLLPGMRVLDLACGTADISVLAAAQVAPSGSVIGIDFSRGMLEVGRRRVQETPFANLIDLRFGSAMDLEFEDNSFDAVTIGFAMRNVKDINRVLREALRVLKPGGRFTSLDAARPEDPVARVGHALLFKFFTPTLDKFSLRLRKDASVKPYTYMSHTLDNHPPVHELREMFVAAGFTFAGYTTIAMGTTSIHWGNKPVSNGNSHNGSSKGVNS
jgi:demethylmenaquinone methyltransferase/2-methoxy-6-polyprenyl-1,4-benzoquinol methylase